MSVFALGIELDGEGSHPAAWRRANHPPSESLSGRTLTQKVRAAENAGFTLATFDDSILPPRGGISGRVDAVNRAAFVAATTSTIGLVPVVETTYAEPFHTSSQLATLDYSSRGRGGWIATRIDDPRSRQEPGAGRFSPMDPTSPASNGIRSPWCASLWDSWEDDAVIRDYASGRFLDRDKLHYVDFEGESFTVKGPAIVPRPPQGQLVVFGGEDRSRAGRRRPRRRARPRRSGRARRAAAAGLTFVEIDVALDTPHASAVDRLAALDGHEPADAGRRLQYTGAATGFVELLSELAGHIDGVRLFPHGDRRGPARARPLRPARPLQVGGARIDRYPGRPCASNLGLERPANRYARI